MYSIDKSVFHLTTLPYLFQSRFMEILPYFQQIELAQTNQQLLQIYETRCRRRSISDSVNIVVTKNGIYINGKRYSNTLYKNERLIKFYIQENYFPTKFLSIINAENVGWVDIGILAKELMKNGLYFKDRNKQKAAIKWMEMDIKADGVKKLKKIEMGWYEILQDFENHELKYKKAFKYIRESKDSFNATDLTHLM